MEIIYFFSIVSLITFVLYGTDKLRAKRGARRIPERVLIACSLLGGGIGGAMGMSVFRHKTKHTYFRIFNFLGVALQIAAVLFAFGII